MPTLTHCLPTGSLATGEMPVIGVPYNASVTGPAPGSRRGIVIIMPGLSVTTEILPPPPTNSGGLFPIQWATLITNLNQDGWLTVLLPTVGSNYVSNQGAGLLNLLNHDGTAGTLYLNAALHWWDHVINWVTLNYGATFPVVPFGVSWGGWHALQVARNRASTITAYGAHVPGMPLWAANADLITYNYLGPSPINTCTTSGSTTPPFTNATINVTGNPITAGYANPAGTLVMGANATTWQILQYNGLTASSFTGVYGGFSATIGSGTALVQQQGYTNGLDVPNNGVNSLNPGQLGSTPLGFIGWETGDNFIGWPNIQALWVNAFAAGQPVTSLQVSGGEHQLSNADVSAVCNSNWVSGGTYLVNQCVNNAGGSFICIVNVSGSTTAPGSDGTHWQSLSGGKTTQGWFQGSVDPLCPAVL